jgi:hypothetical protein
MVYVQSGPICGKPMRQSWQTYLTSHRWGYPVSYHVHDVTRVRTCRGTDSHYLIGHQTIAHSLKSHSTLHSCAHSRIGLTDQTDYGAHQQRDPNDVVEVGLAHVFQESLANLAQNERGCHQRQCSHSTHLFRYLRETMNHPKGLCQNLSSHRSGGTLIVARLVAHANNTLK